MWLSGKPSASLTSSSDNHLPDGCIYVYSYYSFVFFVSYTRIRSPQTQRVGAYLSQVPAEQTGYPFAEPSAILHPTPRLPLPPCLLLSSDAALVCKSTDYTQ